LISETHVAENTTGAADLRLAVADINRRNDLDFVLVSGDITDMNIDGNVVMLAGVSSLEGRY
jgi:3',5'-cyclic AMP phosphodiesterase CpdA